MRYLIVVNESLIRRFHKFAMPEPNTGCWIWDGVRHDQGYGHLSQSLGSRRARSVLKALRVAWLIYRGPIPDDREIDHRCRNRWCVNPDHLEAVTHTENVMRGISRDFNMRKTHCPKGHPYDEENTDWIKRPEGRQERRCKRCYGTRAREYQRRTRGSAPK